ncbi:RTC4-like domain-containing protein [Lyophyllum atratum]|nr:RTC4-like domain-containing protein [Lyophyllum atratum]
MENIVANPTWNKTVPVNDPKLRLLTRPTANARPESSKSNYPKDSRRKGRAVEDLGSSFAKNSSQGKKKPGSKLKSNGRRGATDDDSDSADELDMLSSNYGSDMESIGGKEKKRAITVDDNPKYPSNGNVLKGLKFKKNKRSDDGGQDAGGSRSQPIVLKENGNLDASGSGKSSPPPRPVHTAQTTVRRARSPRRGRSKKSSSPDARRVQSKTSEVSRSDSRLENARPKPRPIGAGKVSAQQHPQALPELIPLGSKSRGTPTRRMTVSGAKPFPSAGRSPPQPSKSMDFGKKPPSPVLEKAKPADFPPLSPVRPPLRPAEFPALTPTGSQEHPSGGKKASGKRSVSEKVAKPKPAEFPMPSPSSGNKATSSSATKKKGRGTTRLVVLSDEDSDGDITETSSSRKAQPFPMSTQMLDGIGSSTAAGPSSLGKRSSPGSDDARKKKKRKEVDSDALILADTVYDEEDTITISPPVDPRTLCPYCDAPLPPFPTPHLKRLLASTEKKSRREPRPDNPLGRTASFAVFIAVCQRHRFEDQILPEAELKGWPKSIDWTEMGKRVRRMKGALRGIIDDAHGKGFDGEYDGLFQGEADEHPRARCIFWKEVMAEVKQKGTRAVAGVRGQFASFEKTQPGYYGELGSVIIHQTLYDLFPPASLDPGLVAPLTPNDFIQRILVPEVGVRLVMEDMGLDESKEKESDVEPPVPASKARPRPRPIGKNSSMASIYTNDVEMASEVLEADGGDTDSDVEFPAQQRVKRPRQPSRSSIPDLPQPSHNDMTPRNQKVGKTRSGVDLDLCTSSDSDGQWDTGRMVSDRPKRGIKTRSVTSNQEGLAEILTWKIVRRDLAIVQATWRYPHPRQTICLPY